MVYGSMQYRVSSGRWGLPRCERRVEGLEVNQQRKWEIVHDGA